MRPKLPLESSITEEEALAYKQIQLDIPFDRAEEIKKEVIDNYEEKHGKAGVLQGSEQTESHSATKVDLSLANQSLFG